MKKLTIEELEQILSSPPGTYEVVLKQLTALVAEGLIERLELMQEKCRVSDEAFNFQLKRANELMEKCNGLEGRVKSVEKERDALRTVCYFRPHPREWWDDTMEPESKKAYKDATDKVNWLGGKP